MKTIKVYCVLACIVAFSNCKKKEVYDSAIIMSVEYDKQPVPNVTVYMKKGATSNPNIPLSDYDKSLSTSSYG